MSTARFDSKQQTKYQAKIRICIYYSQVDSLTGVIAILDFCIWCNFESYLLVWKQKKINENK